MSDQSRFGPFDSHEQMRTTLQAMLRGTGVRDGGTSIYYDYAQQTGSVSLISA